MGTFFEPLAALSLNDLAEEVDSICPPKWSRDKLAENGLNVWDGAVSRLSGLYLLNRPEHLVVTYFFTQVVELPPWLPPDHWLQGADAM